MQQSKIDELARRSNIVEQAADEVVAAVNKARTNYGSRFRHNGGADAILDRARAKLAKPGRKPKSEAAT